MLQAGCCCYFCLTSSACPILKAFFTLLLLSCLPWWSVSCLSKRSSACSSSRHAKSFPHTSELKSAAKAPAIPSPFSPPHFVPAQEAQPCLRLLLMQHGDGGDVYILQREVMMREQGNPVICLYTSTEQFHCQEDKALSFLLLLLLMLIKK